MAGAFSVANETLPAKNRLTLNKINNLCNIITFPICILILVNDEPVRQPIEENIPCPGRVIKRPENGKNAQEREKEFSLGNEPVILANFIGLFSRICG